MKTALKILLLLLIALVPFTAQAKAFRLILGNSIAAGSQQSPPVYLEDPPKSLYATNCDGTAVPRRAVYCDGSPAPVLMHSVPLMSCNCAGGVMVPFIPPGNEVSDVIDTRRGGKKVKYTNRTSVVVERKYSLSRGWHFEADYNR